MNRCILSYISDTNRRYRTHGKDKLLVTFLFLFTMSFVYGQVAPNAQFATFTSSGNPLTALTGTGSFNCPAVPDFTYAITGDVAGGDTTAPDVDPVTGQIDSQPINSNGGGFESIYGIADNAQNIEVEVAGYFGAIGDPISQQVQTTIDFNGVMPANQLAFIIADVEQDQVMVCALDANGNPVPVSVIATWWRSSFDACTGCPDEDPTDGPTLAPTWDTNTGTLVGQEGPGGIKQTTYQMDLPDNEAGAAWFEVNIPITELTFKSEAMGIQPDDPSQHFILASKCAIYDQALIKEVQTAGPYTPGDDVTYNITVCNQGNVDSGVLEISDIIPAGMTLSVNDANGWAGGPAGTVTNTTGNIIPNNCEIVPITLTIDPTFAGGSIINNAVISMDNGDDVDSDPAIIAMLDDLPDNDDLTETDGGDDEDPEEINVQIYDLALIKTETSAGPYSPGDDVTYTITVVNQGTLDAGVITVSDYIPAGMTLSTADNNGWAGGPGGTVTNTIVGPTAGGAPVTVDIVLTIDPNFAGTSLVNDSEISMDNGDDIDSTPGDDAHPDDLGPDDNQFTETDGGDDQDPAEITIIPNVYDLALIKQEVSAGPYEPGDDVRYTITVFNQGTIDAGFIQVSDYIPAGMTLSIADTNGWAGGPSGTVTNIIAGPAAGATPVTIDIVLTIDPNLTGSQDLVNNAEITLDNGDDVDSTPGDNSQPDDFPDNDDPNETDGGDDEDPEVIMVCACDATADAGTMVYPGTSVGCVDDMGSTVTLTGAPTGDAVIPPGYVLSYIISVGYDLQVIDCAATPTYTSSVPGWYTFHAVVYDPNTFDPCSFAGTGTIDDLELLFANDPCICGDIDTKGTELGIYFCCMDMLQLDMNPVPPLLHDANIGLMSKGTVNMPNSTTTFTGGQFVELQRGFTVINGSPFIADIAPCADFGN